MVASRRLKVNEDFYFKTGHLKNCYRFRSSNHRSWWVPGGKEVPCRERQVWRPWPVGVLGPLHGDRHRSDKRGGSTQTGQREKQWQEAEGWMSAPGCGALQGQAEESRGARSGEERWGRRGSGFRLTWVCIPAPPLTSCVTLQSPHVAVPSSLRPG